MIDFNDQRSMAQASILADDGRETFRAIYPRRTPRLDDVKRASMRPAGVRKMRQSRKRRKGKR